MFEFEKTTFIIGQFHKIVEINISIQRYKEKCATIPKKIEALRD